MISALLALSALISAHAETSLDVRLAATLTPAVCANAKADPLAAARKEIDKFETEKKTKKALEKQISEWLESENTSDKPVPTLAWIKAIDPWLLPEKFPAKAALESCAAELREYSDARTKDARDEWKSCLDLVFAGEKPAEFRVISNCLEQQALEN